MARSSFLWLIVLFSHFATKAAMWSSWTPMVGWSNLETMPSSWHWKRGDPGHLGDLGDLRDLANLAPRNPSILMAWIHPLMAGNCHRFETWSKPNRKEKQQKTFRFIKKLSRCNDVWVKVDENRVASIATSHGRPVAPMEPWSVLRDMGLGFYWCEGWHLVSSDF